MSLRSKAKILYLRYGDTILHEDDLYNDRASEQELPFIFSVIYPGMTWEEAEDDFYSDDHDLHNTFDQHLVNYTKEIFNVYCEYVIELEIQEEEFFEYEDQVDMKQWQQRQNKKLVRKTPKKTPKAPA